MSDVEVLWSGRCWAPSSLVALTLSASLTTSQHTLALSEARCGGGWGRTQRQFLNIGGLSLALFAINVTAIFAVSVAIFRFKGIRPIRRQLLNWEVCARATALAVTAVLWLLAPRVGSVCL